MARNRIGLFLLVASCAVLSWALPAGATKTVTHVTHATTVTVTAGKPSEFRFTLSVKKVRHGVVKFKVTNKGNLPHDFKIAGHKTRLLSPLQTQTLKVTFTKARKYPYLCTVTGHAAAGMKGTPTVT
jgi:uncharacterized cupredoxin-like copper-binding protein